MRRNSQRFLLSAIWAALLLCASGTALGADARTVYLINMLEKGGNYRIRVQAATTLGKLRSKDAVPALVRALRDKHELVVISASTALGQIGDSSVVPAMEQIYQNTRSKAAKSQLMSTLRVLKALSSKDKAQAPPVSSKPRYLVRIDAMGNSSGAQIEGILETLREFVVGRLSTEPGVVLQEAALDHGAVRQKLKKEGLAGYIISGSLLRMERLGDRVIVKIGLNVFSNPDYNLLMMPTVEAAVPVRPGVLSASEREQVQSRAMKAVINRLIADIFGNLRRENP